MKQTRVSKADKNPHVRFLVFVYALHLFFGKANVLETSLSSDINCVNFHATFSLYCSLIIRRFCGDPRHSHKTFSILYDLRDLKLIYICNGSVTYVTFGHF